MEHLKITSVRHLKVKGVMNMSEKVGRLGLARAVSSHGRENLQESNVLPNSFFMNKRRTWRHQSRDQSVLNVFCLKLANFCCFSQKFLTLSLRNYYNSIFKAKVNKSRARSLKVV